MSTTSNKNLPMGEGQMAAMASYAVACPDCPAQPYEPCQFVKGPRKGQPRSEFTETHRWRQARGVKALNAWRAHQWPNTRDQQIAS